MAKAKPPKLICLMSDTTAFFELIHVTSELLEKLSTTIVDLLR